MVALPCGSRSTINTRCPTLPRPAARFTVVVVLPTPPFWFATQKILAMPGLTGHGQLHAEADQEDTRDLVEDAADERIGLQALGQEVRQQHHDQAVQEG